jgi:hypothetical protein
MDDLERALFPEPEAIVASAVQYLIGRREEAAARLILACAADIVGVDWPFHESDPCLVKVEVLGPARVYDLLTSSEGSGELGTSASCSRGR